MEDKISRSNVDGLAVDLKVIDADRYYGAAAGDRGGKKRAFERQNLGAIGTRALWENDNRGFVFEGCGNLETFPLNVGPVAPFYKNASRGLRDPA